METVKDFYRNKSIFITGGTGFLGKVLIEKLLFDCSDLRKIYLLMRSRKGQSLQEKIEKFFSAPIFQLRLSSVDFGTKVEIIEGDVLLPNFGLSSRNLDILFENVNVVFHCAASIKFDEPLELAYKINCQGSATMLELCKLMKKLNCFVHVSTAYSNCNLDSIKEKVYPLKITSTELPKILQSIGQNQFELEYFEGRPNTYTFCKALTENHLAEQHSGISVAIARPPVILTSKQEPEIGYCDSAAANNFAFIAQALGICRTVKFSGKEQPDGVGVDTVVNSLLVIAKELADSGRLEVFNVTTNLEKMINLHQYFEYKNRAIRQAPLLKSLRAPADLSEPSTFSYFLTKYFSEFLYPLIYDCLNPWSKSKLFPKIWQMQVVREGQNIFLAKTWHFDRSKLNKIMDQQSEQDRKNFDLDPVIVDYEEHAYRNWLWLRKLKLKESPSNIKDALQRNQRMKQMENFANCLLVLIVIGVTYVLARCIFD